MDAPQTLRNPATIRARAEAVYAAAEAGSLDGFALSLDRLDDAAAAVAAVTLERFPDLDIPYHARWRHFVLDGVELSEPLLGVLDADERGRSAFDLAITSVLLDAGAGDAWRFRDAETGLVLARSEGLAVASLRAFAAGAMAAHDDTPLRADAARLASIGTADVAAWLQAGPSNRVAGLEGRAALMRALADAVRARPDLFPGERLGGLFDTLRARAVGGALAAPAILAAVLDGLSPIFAGRVALDGVPLGDVWSHPRFGLVPLHKLSQWLSYSLVEPLEDAGVPVTELDGLTGLAEYRNGGLFVDSGVLTPKFATDEALDPGDPRIVEWRALTVALLDRVADRVRARLGHTAETMPLASVLEGGTWHTGRRLAAERRPGGGPPICIVSDGTVF